jgi:organic hydroperoxide reductase OsmC/OhrA
MDQSHQYRVEVSGVGPKTGALRSPDDLPPLTVGSPPQFGGSEGVWSPEHLFVAAVSSCLMTTFRAIADMSSLEVVDYEDSASGLLVRGEDGLYQMAEITLRPRVTIADPDKMDKALRLLDKAERVCLISRSIKSQVHMEPKVEVVTLV